MWKTHFSCSFKMDNMEYVSELDLAYTSSQHCLGRDTRNTHGRKRDKEKCRKNEHEEKCEGHA